MKLLCLYMETRLSRQVNGAALAPYVVKHLAKCPRCARSARIWSQIATGVEQIRMELPSSPDRGWQPLELPRRSAMAGWPSARQTLVTAGLLGALLFAVTRFGPQVAEVVAGSRNTQPPRATVTMLTEAKPTGATTANRSAMALNGAQDPMATVRPAKPVSSQVRVTAPPIIRFQTASVRADRVERARQAVERAPQPAVSMASRPLNLPAVSRVEASADTISVGATPAMTALRVSSAQPVPAESEGVLARPVLDSAVYEPSRISE